MNNVQDKIINYLKDKYDPEAIVLAGSRATGHEIEGSDWDLWLLNPTKKDGAGFLKFEDQSLNVTLKDWPEGDNFLTIPYKPLWPSKFIFTKSKEKAEELIEKTKEAYSKGPLDLYKDSVMDRFKRLYRWKTKIEQNVDNPPVEFLYAGYFYEVCIRAWFELKNRWPVSPRQGLPEIKEDDQDFYNLLIDFYNSSSKDRPQIVNKILERLESFI